MNYYYDLCNGLMRRLTLSPRSKKVRGPNPPADWSLSVWSLRALPMRWFGFWLPCPNPKVNWLFKIVYPCECECKSIFISDLALRQTARGAPSVSPEVSWDWRQLSRDPEWIKVHLYHRADTTMSNDSHSHLYLRAI